MPDFPRTGGTTPNEVWGHSGRSLDGDPGDVIRDAVVSDATKIPGANIDASIASRAPASEYDIEMAHLDVDLSSRADGAQFTADRAAKMDAIQNFAEDAVGTLTATGAEDTVKESTDEGKLHCFIDLTNMEAGDSITVRQSMKVKAAGAYILYKGETYSGVQAEPLLHVVMKPAKHGQKVTLEQTAGTNKDFDWETFIEKAA